MADGKITGRLIRHYFQQHSGKESGTLYLTLVKSRGTYKDAQGITQTTPSDFLTFEQFIPETPAATNRKELLQRLADESTLVELEYMLKSSSYTDGTGNRVFKEFKRLISFEILESKQAVRDRLNKQDSTHADTDLNTEVEESDTTDFDPEEAGAFVQNTVTEHLVKPKEESTDEGQYGNPFNN